MKNIRDDFQAEVERFLANSDMSPTAFGLAAAQDPSFISRVRNNRNFRADTMQRVLRYIETQRSAA